jgi:hypothetical protein
MMPPTLSRLVRSAIRIVRLPLEKAIFHAQLAGARLIEQQDIAYAKSIVGAMRVRLYGLLVAACGARGAPPPVVGLDSPVTPPTFDVFYRLQVTNYGVFYVLFDSPPSGSNPIDIWDLCLHAQMAFPDYFRSNGFSNESAAGASRKSCFDSVRDLTRTNRSPLLLHEPDNVIETHEDAGDFKDRSARPTPFR